MKKFILPSIFLLFLTLTVLCSCGNTETYYGNLYDVKYVTNYDGDTVTFNIPYLHSIVGDHINVRVAGVDTPEIKGRCLKEKVLAKQAQKEVQKILTHAHKISLNNIKRGKYFRIIANVIVDGQDLSTILLNKHMAVPYDGGHKSFDWCTNQAVSE